MRLFPPIVALLGIAALAMPSIAQQASQSPVRAAAAPTVSTTTGPQLTRQDVEGWLDGYMPYAIARGDVAGAVVVVVKDGQVLLEKGYGYSDVARRQSVDPASTIFRAGSVSKLVTWTAVMQLVEQGKIDLDRDVNAYLDFKIPPRNGRPITMRNLMTHTAGFEERMKGLMSSNPKGGESLEYFLKVWTSHRIHPAGQVPAYSNYGAALAGYIVGRVSGEGFDGYLDHHIFAPLGMQHSSFRQPLPAALQPLVSRGYNLGSGPSKPYEMVAPSPAGSLALTGDDMARFMIAHLQNGAYGSVQILRPETAKLMHDTPLTIIPNLNRMLLGFYESGRNGHRVIGHGGDTQWFHSDLRLLPDDGVGLFISVNSKGKDGASSAIREYLYEGFADRYFPGAQVDGVVDAATAAQHAGLMVGLYDNTRRPESSFLSLLGLPGQVKVTTNADGTISVSGLQGINGQTKKWREISPFVWRDVDGKERLAAKVEGGKVVMFGSDQWSPVMMFQPAPWWRASSWLVPALLVSLGALLLTAILWPVVAIVRWRYGAEFSLQGREARAHRLVRAASAVATATLVLWVGTIGKMFSDFTQASAKMDGWLTVLQAASFVVFFGAALVGVWNAWVVWTGRRSWFAKLWSAALAAAFLVVLWVVVIFHLANLNVNY